MTPRGALAAGSSVCAGLFDLQMSRDGLGVPPQGHRDWCEEAN